MKTFQKSILYFFLTVGLFSCQTQKNISGNYRSNFADLGFFITRIKLKQDSSFEYRFRGDMISDTATGKYKIDKRRLILTYDPRPIDTSGFAYLRTIGFKLDNLVNLKSDAGYSHIYYIRNDKLYGSLQDGKIVRKAVRYSKRKKYLFFGTHYFKHRHYLKRID